MADQIYYSVFTKKGLELLTEAIQNGTKLGISSMAFGDGGGSLPVPNEAFSQLVNEVHRTQLNSLAPDPNNANWLRAEAIIASAVGGFNIRELGLYAGDVLVAYSNYPATYKPNPSDGTARIMTFRMVLQIDNTSNFDLVIDPDVVLATIQYVNEIAIDSKIKTTRGRNQEEKNSDILSIEDVGGNRDSFDPSAHDAIAKKEAIDGRKPYLGPRQMALPMQTLKVWNFCDGYLDRGAVVSIRNVANFDADEPRTEVLGIENASGLGDYSDRDVVGLFVQTDGQPALFKSNNTIFTSTTLTCNDLSEEIIKKIKKDQIIDVSDNDIEYSGLIKSINGKTITIDTAWFRKFGNGATGTPSNGSEVKFVPNTKIWGQNTNVTLGPDADAKSFAGFELGLFNNTGRDGAGYGYDVWSGGTNQVSAAFQARGKYQTGLYLYDSCSTGTYVSNPVNVGHIVVGGSYGFISHDQNVGFLSRGAGQYSFAHTTIDGTFITAVNKAGAWEGLRYSYKFFNSAQTIDQEAVVVLVTPSTDLMLLNLPGASSNAYRTLFIRNLSSQNNVKLIGVFEDGIVNMILKPKTTVHLFCDATYWYPMSEFSSIASSS